MQVAGAAIDVYPSEPPPPELESLVMHPKIVCSPHLGASTKDAQVKKKETHVFYRTVPVVDRMKKTILGNLASV